jgi:transposase
MPRSYNRVKEHEAEIMAMKAEGRTSREIAEHLGFSDKKIIKQFMTRKNQKERQAGIRTTVPQKRGRPRKRPIATENEKDNEIRRLTMENELLRDFLRLAGRR